MVAQVARSLGILTVGIVTAPFSFEGQRRKKQAHGAIEALRDHVDALIVIPNDRLLAAVGQNTPLNEAFTVADDVLRHGVRGISDIVQVCEGEREGGKTGRGGGRESKREREGGACGVEVAGPVCLQALEHHSSVYVPLCHFLFCSSVWPGPWSGECGLC